MERIFILLLILGGLYWLRRWINSSRSRKPTPRLARGGAADSRKMWNDRRQPAKHTGSKVTGFNTPRKFVKKPASNGHGRIDQHHLLATYDKDENAPAE